MKQRHLTPKERCWYYARYLALRDQGVERPAISERLGIPYFTLCDIIERYELKGRYTREAK